MALLKNLFPNRKAGLDEESALRERVRELECQHKFAALCASAHMSLPEFLGAAVEAVPPGWQYPEITCARISLDGEDFETRNFKETKWMQSAQIPLESGAGRIDVCYLKKKPELDEGPFLAEERALLQTLAFQLGALIAREREKERATRITNILRGVRNVNQLITREKDTQRLIEGVCENLVADISFAMAWIILTDKEGNITGSACRGTDDKTNAWCVNWSASNVSSCPALALESSSLVVIDPGAACTACPARELCEGRPRLARRLEFDGKVYGVIVAALPHHSDADAEEKSLFNELAGDISFALRQQDLSKELEGHTEKVEAAMRLGNLAWWEMLMPSGTVTCDDLKLEMLDRDPKEYQGVHYSAFTDLLHPDDYPKAMLAMRDHLEGRAQTYEVDYRIRKKDGSYIWMHDCGGITERDEDGNPIRVAGIVVNITHLKEAEEKLRESESRFRNVYEHMAIGIARVSLDYRIEQANEAYCKMLGFSEEELVGKTLHEITHPETLEENVRLQDRLRKGEIDHFRLEKGFLHKDGHTVYGVLDANLVRDAEGKPQYFLGSVLDISDLKNAEKERLRSERLLDFAIDQLPVPVIIAEGPDVRITRYNKAVIDMLVDSSATVEDIKLAEHRSFWPTFHPDGTPYDVEDLPLTQAIKKGKVTQGREIIVRQGDEDRWISASAAPLYGENGEIIAGIVVFPEITKRKMLEEQLRQSQKLEAVGQLAGGVAHDFNNILMALQGNATLLLEMMEDESREKEYVSEIFASSDRAVKLTRQLLAFSRRQIIQPTDLDMNQVVSDMLKMIRRTIGEHIALVFKPHSGIRRVHADVGQMEQVILNLCVNARDAMPEGGDLLIETGRLNADASYREMHPQVEEGEYTLLSVTDTGVGMEPEVAARIFEPFFTTKEKGKGTGLGLSMVYGILRQHGGYIHAYSEVGQGTTFKALIPATEGCAEAVDEDEVVPAAGGTETILVAEDDADVRRLAQRMLESAGYTLLLAGDGEEAMKIGRENIAKIDLAVLDVVMPRASGKAVADALHEKRPGLPIIFSSGYSDSSIHTGFVLDEHTTLIEKPYSRNDLLQAIRDKLDGR